jgi:hypothetical protein
MNIPPLMSIPPGTDGVVLAGVAGQGNDAYAADTDDLIKILAENEITLRYQEEGDHDRLLLKSADWWGPVLIFTQQALADGLGNLLANAVWELISKRPKTHIHLDVGCFRDERSEVTWFKGEGSADEVLEALRIWHGD